MVAEFDLPSRMWLQLLIPQFCFCRVKIVEEASLTIGDGDQAILQLCQQIAVIEPLLKCLKWKPVSILDRQIQEWGPPPSPTSTYFLLLALPIQRERSF